MKIFSALAAPSLVMSSILLLQSSLLGQVSAPGTPGNGIRPTQDVLLVRDDTGTAHVYATTDAGAYYGAGYAAAEDRFFQMSWRRLIFQGRAAEFFGPGSVQQNNGSWKDTHILSDRRMRIFGVARYTVQTAINIDLETRKILQAYADGVNAYLNSPSATLHPFFAQFAIPVEAWTVEDCIGIWFLIGDKFQSDGLGEAEILHDFMDLISQGYTREEAEEILTGVMVCDDTAAVVQISDVPAATQQAMQDYANSHGLNVSGNCPTVGADFHFSHAWAVAGSHTQTGNSMLLGDPRVTVYIPSLFYEWSMQGETFSASGMGVPGAPNILSGRTNKVAWSPTALGADQADLFFLTTDPTNHPGEYELDGAWRPFEVDQSETLLVLGGTPETIHYRETIWGPVVTAITKDAQVGEEFALRMVPMDDPSADSATGFLQMYRAQNAQELFTAMGQWRFPSANIIFADTNGGIGYVANGVLPIRNPSLTMAGVIAQNGASSSADWIDLLPHDLKPHVFNPADGYVFSANHMPIGSWYPIPARYGSGSRGDGVRSRQIRHLLESIGTGFSARDVLDLHHNTVNSAYRDFVELGLFLRDVQASYTLSSNASNALAHLESWWIAGADSDNQHYATALAVKQNLMFRINTAGDLAVQFGGGDNGLSLFLKSMLNKAHQSIPVDLTRVEAAFIDQVLGDALVVMLAIEPNSANWQLWYSDNVQNVDLPHWTSLEGFPSLDPGAVTPITVTTGDGGTLLSPKAQAFTQFVELGPASDLTVLPIGAAEIGVYAEDQKTIWETEVLKLAPIRLQEVLNLGISSIKRLKF